jgi:deoxycytidylate deaminase
VFNKKDVISLRLEKHDLYMSEAKFASKRSTCHKNKVGVVLLIGTLSIKGYTGNLPDQQHCEDIYKEKGDVHRCNCNSAELNAFFTALKSQTPVTTFYGATLYTTDSINVEKLGQLISAGIKEVIYGKQNSDEKEVKDLKKFAEYNNVKIICYEDYNQILDENVNKVLLEVENIFFKRNEDALK